MKVKSNINFKKDLHFNIFTYLNEFLHWDITISDLKIYSELYNIDFEMLSSGAVKNYEDRMSILFSVDTKKKIMEDLKMSYNTFNNSLSKLRKKGLITKDNTIDEKRLFNLNNLVFNFTIEYTNG
jgi:hypothetical protein